MQQIVDTVMGDNESFNLGGAILEQVLFYIKMERADPTLMLYIVFATGIFVSIVFMLQEGVKTVDEKEFEEYDAYTGKLSKYILHEQRRNLAYQSSVVLLLILLVIIIMWKEICRFRLSFILVFIF